MVAVADFTVKTFPWEFDKVSSEQIEHLPLELIVAKPQVRQTFDEELLDEMIASLKEVGQLQPIRVRPEEKQYIIVTGERRFRGIKALGWPTIAAIIEGKNLNEAETLQRQLIENCQRAGLTAAEKGMAIAQLMRVTGWNASQTAAKLGMSSAMATRFMALLSLPQGILEMVNKGDIPASAAYELTRITDPKEQSEFAQKLATRQLTRDGLVGELKSANRKQSGKQTGSRATALLGEGRSVTVVGLSLDLESFIATLEDVLTRARRARPQGVELSTFIAMLKDQSQSA